MKRSVSKIKIFLVLSFVALSILNISWILRADDQDCWTYSYYCEDSLWNLCELLCKNHGGCVELYLEDWECNSGICDQEYDLICDDWHVIDNIPCIAGDKNCPVK